MSTDKPISHQIAENLITIFCPSDKWKIEISTQEEHAKQCGFLYIILKRSDKREPSIAQWVYRHIEEAKLAFLVVGLKLESPDKHILYSDLKQIVSTKQFHNAIDQAKLFEEVASARIPFCASVEERAECSTVLEVTRKIIAKYGEPKLLKVLSLR